MLKETVTYIDPFSEQQVTETLYFNISKAELAELALTEPDYGKNLEAIARRENGKELLEMVKDLIRRAYGEVEEIDGQKRFLKSAERTELFMGTEAYSEFFYGLFTDPSKTAAFVNAAMPQQLIQEAEEIVQNGRPQPQDRLPKQTKTVDLPAEDVADVSLDTTTEFTSRREQLESRPQSELTLDELIELRDLQS